MNLCAIVPVPAAVVGNPAAVLTPIGGEPALARIVRSLRSVTDTDVVIACAAALAADIADGVAGAPATVLPVTGDAPTVSDCLTVARAALPPVTHVLVADHRHPVLPEALLHRVVTALAGGAELAVPVLPVTDTVKVVDAQGVIHGTVDRSELVTVQYPWGMTAARLAALEDLDAVLAGGGITTVDGDADAVDVDLPADAALLEAAIACR